MTDGIPHFFRRAVLNKSVIVVNILIYAFLIGCNSKPDSMQKEEFQSAQTSKQVITESHQSKQLPYELAKNWSFGYENYRNGNYQEAIEYFWKVSKLDTHKKFPKVYCYISECYIALEKPDSAAIVDEIGREKHADIFCK